MVLRNSGELIEKLKLDRRAGKALYSVDTRRVDNSALGSYRSKPADVDTEAAVGRSAGGELQDVELAARLLYLGAKPGSRFFVVLGKVFRRLLPFPVAVFRTS